MRFCKIDIIVKAPFNADTIPKAYMIDGEKLIDDAYFPRERYLQIITGKAVSQKLGQGRDERLCARRLLLIRHAQNDAQCVEEEMRVNLAAQQLQTCAFHRVLQFQSLGLTAVQLAFNLVFLLQRRKLLCH